jgi:hypothetical protein
VAPARRFRVRRVFALVSGNLCNRPQHDDRRYRKLNRKDRQTKGVAGAPDAVANERLSEEPHTRLRSYCSPHHQDTALYPTIAQLERAAGFRRDDTDEQRLDKVLAQATNDLSEVVPLLAVAACCFAKECRRKRPTWTRLTEHCCASRDAHYTPALLKR